MSQIGFWIKNARSISLPQSALPCLTAIVLCIGQDIILVILSHLYRFLFDCYS